MTTTSRKTPPWRQAETDTVVDSPPPVQSLIEKTRAVMASHAGLRAAREKLRALDAQRAIMQSEFDQQAAEISNPDLQELSEKILAGESLAGIDSAVEKRDATRLKLQGFAVALVTQRKAIEREVKAASILACDDLAVPHRAAVDRLLNAFSEIKGAVTDLQSVKSAIEQNEVTADGRLVFYSLQELVASNRHLDHLATTFWVPWVTRQTE